MKKKLFACFLAVMLVTVLVFVAAPSTKAADATVVQAEGNGEMEVDTSNILDLNGWNVIVTVPAGETLYVIDTANNKKDGTTGAGTLTLKDGSAGSVAVIAQNPANKMRYAAIQEGKTYSFHPFNLTVSQVGLNTKAGDSDEEVAICLRSAYLANDKLVNSSVITDYGICPVVDGKPKSGAEVSAKTNYPIDGKNYVDAYYDFMGSLAADKIDITNTYCAYMVVNGKTVYSSAVAEITPRNVLKTINKEKDINPTEAQLERIKALDATTYARARRILSRLTGDVCVDHHGGIAPYMEQAACIDCDSKYGELGIPEGAVMVTDFGTAITPTLLPNNGQTNGWGSAGETWETFSEYDGRTGVFALGKVTQSWFGLGCLEKMDLTQYESITFRMKINSKMSGMWLLNGLISGQRTNVDMSRFTNGEWIEYTLSTASIPSTRDTENSGTLTFQTSVTDATDYSVYIDQIYVTPKADTVLKEQDIPEGATLVTNFSEKGNHTLLNYGTYANATDNWYQMCAGAVGVQAFGTTELSGGTNFLKWSDIIPNDFDYSAYTHITFRVYFTDIARIVYLGTCPYNNGSVAMTDTYDLYNEDHSVTPAKGQWHEITIPLSELDEFDLYVSNKTWNYGDVVLFDQVYVERKEIDTPEGATLITDFSNAVTPFLPPIPRDDIVNGWGTAGETWLTLPAYDGRAYVFALGGTESPWFGLDCLSGMDLSQYESITFRMKISEKVNGMWLLNGYIKSTRENIEMTNLVKKGEWIEFKVDIGSLTWSNKTDVSLSFQMTTSGTDDYYMYIDQILVTPKS